LLTRVPLKQRQVLHSTGQRIRSVYFPVEGVCSILPTMEDGRTVEVAMIGREGVVGIPSFLGMRYSTCDAIVWLPGFADAMPLEGFVGELKRHGPFHDIVCRYAGILFSSVTQSAACNGLHAADGRCATWLLHAHDRVGKDTFSLTQELLAVLLGVRRATITSVASEFQRESLVEFGRRRVTVLDRAGLEALACECYRVTSGQGERLV
jgi:CRP-like cAMP-binding protein